MERIGNAVVEDLDIAGDERGGSDRAVEGDGDGDRVAGRLGDGIGPIELAMICGPAAMTIGRYQMFSGSPTTAPLMMVL